MDIGKKIAHFLGKAIGLPDHFLALKEGSTGGGVIQASKIRIL